MLINLLSNAIKFTPEGGKVAVGAKRLGSRLHFWVSDTGIGIAEDDLARLGRPFTQVRNDYTRAVSRRPASACRWSRGWWRCTTAR